MNIFTKAYLTQHLLRYRLKWDKRDTFYRPKGVESPKFLSPREAVERYVRDGQTVAFSGLGAQQRVSILYWAIRELFDETGHPRDLDVLCVSGLGGRGKLPGTLEELGAPGLVRRLITGHAETVKSFLHMADAGEVELHCMPQGVLALLVEAQMNGQDRVVLESGVGTVMDPRVGRGSPVTPGSSAQFVEAHDDGLVYTAPKIDVAVFNLPAADAHGNLYAANAAMIGEAYELAKAAKRNGGAVIANVGVIVEPGYDAIFLPANDVDAIVAWPETEQTFTVPHRKHWSMFTPNSALPVDEGVARAKHISTLLGLTPRRTAADDVVARLAAQVFAQNARQGNYVNIGVGLPEEVSRLMYDAGLFDDLTLITESGALGGVPLPGVFFGAMANPSRIISSPEVFRFCYEHLDVAILGGLQVDSQGNVNVSKRGEGAVNYVGPGGFIDLTAAAKMVIFVASWMAHARYAVEGGRLKLQQPGPCKFVDEVDEITFNGTEALKAGKKLFYVTHVGVFQLTQRGMELIRVMPGLDVRKDVLDAAPMQIALPESGAPEVVEPAVITGKGFRLELPA